MARRATTARWALLFTSARLVVGNWQQQKTQYDGKPPGWRPDLPQEDGVVVVHRMRDRLRSHSVEPGPFFASYFDATEGMRAAHAALLPATLKGDLDSTAVDAEMARSLARAEAAMAWQGRQIGHLEAAGRWSGVNASLWPRNETEHLIAVCGVVEDLDELSEDILEATGEDLVAILKIFAFTFASMPDDEEATAITRERNREAGYPPPSVPPPMPKRPPVPGGGAAGRGGGAEAPQSKRWKGRRKKKKARVGLREEL
eukprot:4306615-Prymnesium_polylepis.1